MRSMLGGLALSTSIFALAAAAQAATVTGMVKGPDGAPFRGAFVAAQNLKTKMTVNVQSRGDGPVPPVVSSRSTFSASHSPISATRTLSNPSGMTRRTGSHGEVIARDSHAAMAGPPRSSYSPRDARSDTVRMPMRTIA